MKYHIFKEKVSKLLSGRSTTSEEDVSSLLVQFLHGSGGGYTKEDLIERLKKINLVSEDIPTRGVSNDELVGQASLTLSQLMRVCESLEEWLKLVESLDDRFRIHRATIEVFDLFALIKKLKPTQK